MKKILLIIIAVVAVIGGLVYLNNNNSSSNKTSTVPRDAVVVDVRTPEEFNSGHVPGAINWPVEEIRQKSGSTVSTASELYIYCRSGNRSAEAKQLLDGMGYSNVVDMGGLQDVGKYGLTVE